MGQKVNPNGFRTGITKEWKVCWFSEKRNSAYRSMCVDDRMCKYFKRYGYLLEELPRKDYRYTYKELVGISSKVKSFLDKFRPEERHSGRKYISEMRMVYSFKYFVVYIKCSNSGIIVGEKGSNIAKVTNALEKLCGCQMQINVLRTGDSSLCSSLSLSIFNRIRSGESYRRVIRNAINPYMNNPDVGIKVLISGRLGGAEIARSDKFTIGRIPSHTLRSNIEYSCRNIDTTYGTLGLKIWVYKGEIYEMPKVLLTAEPKTDIVKDRKRRGYEINK